MAIDANANIDQATVIADYLICECRARGESITNLKLQKLLYYADAWHLALYGDTLFEDEFQAWVHGPVLENQYHRFKKHGWRPIADEIAYPIFSDDIQKHLDEIIDVFGSENGVALELMTHREAPWLEARGELPPTEPSSAKISKERMKAFYRDFNGG